MRDLVTLAMWLGIGIGVTALVAVVVEQRVADHRASNQHYDPARDARDSARARPP